MTLSVCLYTPAVLGQGDIQAENLIEKSHSHKTSRFQLGQDGGVPVGMLSS